MKLKPKPLTELETKYGLDFRRKLGLYRTATLNGNHVSICEIDPNTLDALVKDTDGKFHNCLVTDLDNFTL